MTPRYRSMFVLASAMYASLCVTVSADAQGTGQGASHDCQQAANVLRAFDQSVVNSGGHANQGAGKLEQRQLAAERLATCGAVGGLAAAQTIRATRVVTDTATLRVLLAGFTNFRDTAVVSAAMSVAADPAATIPARVYALKTVWNLRKGNPWIPYENFLPSEQQGAIWSARCGSGVQLSDGHAYWTEGATPPGGVRVDAAGICCAASRRSFSAASCTHGRAVRVLPLKGDWRVRSQHTPGTAEIGVPGKSQLGIGDEGLKGSTGRTPPRLRCLAGIGRDVTSDTRLCHHPLFARTHPTNRRERIMMHASWTNARKFSTCRS